MFSIIRTTSDNSDFKNLVALLDEDLKVYDGDEHAFYDQFNKVDTIKNVVVFYSDDVAAGCGAFKAYNPTTAEVKRCLLSISNAEKESPRKLFTNSKNGQKNSIIRKLF